MKSPELKKQEDRDAAEYSRRRFADQAKTMVYASSQKDKPNTKISAKRIVREDPK
jgi:hypothetical protein